MATQTLDAGALEELSRSFSGDLITADAPAYEEARRLHNGLIDKRPRLIARCQGTADVVDALGLARRCGLEVAVRGGGHNVAGRASVDGGLMIDLSLMKGIEVDPARRTATVQPGVTWGELNRETQLFGLAVTGGTISTTGVAGLTLGGGIGWMMGLHGLACDNLIGAEIVLADGNVLQVSEASEAELLWALRGGGGNFGVVTCFHFRLHPIGPDVVGGMVAHPFSRARELLRFHREVTADCPDALSLQFGLVHAPDGSGTKLAAQVACYCGDPTEGEEAVRALKQFGHPVLDTLGRTTYSAVNTILDAMAPRGALNYWKSCFLKELDDPAIDLWIEQFERSVGPLSGLILEHIHGEATRRPVEATACTLRHEGHNALIIAQWQDPEETDDAVAWCRNAYAAMQPCARACRSANYLDQQEQADPNAVAETYGPNYARLQSIKAQYDPGNFFHLNQNVPPGLTPS